MWGSPEALELCAIQMMELEVLHYKPDLIQEQPGCVLDAYTAEVAKLYGSGTKPLWDVYHMGPYDRSFEAVLFGLCQAVRSSLLPSA